MHRRTRPLNSYEKCHAETSSSENRRALEANKPAYDMVLLGKSGKWFLNLKLLIDDLFPGAIFIKNDYISKNRGTHLFPWIFDGHT